MTTFISCNTPRRVYLGNKTDNTITLEIDSSFTPESGTLLSVFKDSLNGKRIEPGHIIINFGPGKWSESDEDSFKKVIQNISVIKDGSSNSFKLPPDIKVGHGVFIPELIIKIYEP